MPVKTIHDLRWMPMFGDWDQEGLSTITFHGREFSGLRLGSNQEREIHPEGDPVVYVNHGQIVFNERFTEGRIRARVVFEDVDYRSNMNIAIQTNTSSNNLLLFGVMGGFVSPELGSGYQYALRRYGISTGNSGSDRGVASAPIQPVYTDLFRSGEGKNLRSGYPYEIEITVKGAAISATVNEMEVMRYTLDQPSLLGEQVGLFGGNRSEIYVDNFEIGA